jgi:hypothetical protein
MLDQISRTEDTPDAPPDTGALAHTASPSTDPRWLTPKFYSNAGPAVIVPLFEDRSGWTISIIEQTSGEVGIYQAHDRRGSGKPDDTLWLHAWINDHHEDVFTYVSEERGRTVRDQTTGEWTNVAEHRSPWDAKVEKALAQVRVHARGAPRARRPSLLTLWRHFIFLIEWYDTHYDDGSAEWRFNRVIRQIQNLGMAVAEGEASTPAEIKIKVEYLVHRWGALAPNRDVLDAVRTASRALNRLAAKPKHNQQEALRHAA